MEVSTEVLRKQVMVSQFVNAVGCSPEEATQILTSVRWQFEVCLLRYSIDYPNYIDYLLLY